VITRSLTYEELKTFKWKFYPMEITTSTNKQDIINFINSKRILTSEKAFNQYPIYIDTIDNEIIIITKDNRKILGMYDHIYKGNIIKIKIDNKWYNWSQVKNKIKQIIFFDNLEYHELVRNLWTERGFSFIKFYQEGIKDKLVNELLKIA
jgi:hypothetical protein